jgi:hypothetical protein
VRFWRQSLSFPFRVFAGGQLSATAELAAQNKEFV